MPQPNAGNDSPTLSVVLAGVCAGAVVAARWRPIVKSAVKVGIVGTAKMTRTALRCAEDLVDVVQEARSELAEAAGAGPLPAPEPGAPVGLHSAGNGDRVRARAIALVRGN